MGAAGTGKSLAAHAMAHAAGVAFFDLSPRNTDGKYLGRAATTLVRFQ